MRISYRTEYNKAPDVVAEGDGEVVVQVDLGAADPLYLSIREESPGVLRLRTREALTIIPDAGNSARVVLWLYGADGVEISASGVVRKSTAKESADE
jgi:type III secretion system FlhB-like substrate exporter